MLPDPSYTSRNIIPRFFKALGYLLSSGTTNLDFGGGKYDTVTKMLEKNGIKNIVLDPFSRPYEYLETSRTLGIIKIDSVTCLNVLNVIISKEERIAELKKLFVLCLVNSCTMYVQVYEGNRSGVASDGLCQTNMRLEEYIPEIESAGFAVKKLGRFLLCDVPKPPF